MRRRAVNDADTDLTREHARLDRLFGFPDDRLLAPISVGWREPGHVAGGDLVCVRCATTPPTARHVPVFNDSYLAGHRCVRCGSRLADTAA